MTKKHLKQLSFLSLNLNSLPRSATRLALLTTLTGFIHTNSVKGMGAVYHGKESSYQGKVGHILEIG